MMDGGALAHGRTLNARSGQGRSPKWCLWRVCRLQCWRQKSPLHDLALTSDPRGQATQTALQYAHNISRPELISGPRLNYQFSYCLL